jgi:FkbM family methyltransferase
MSIPKTTLQAAILLALPLFCIACQKQEEAAAPASPSLNEHDVQVAAEVAAMGSQFDSAKEITDEDRAAYGNRTPFFKWTPETHRAQLDWRTVLSEPLADAEPNWSQGFEEVIIRDYFGDKKNGVFLDVGCAGPKFDSTTYYLEKMLGWTGIGIDAMDYHAETWKEHRPGSTFLAYAVADTDNETLTFHVGNVSNSLNEDLVKNFGGKKKEIQVTTITLDTALENNGIEKIDFLSMDIEGAEPIALKGFDIQRFKPDLCCVEGVNRPEVREYFESNGYELIEKYLKADKINWYFRPKS